MRKPRGMGPARDEVLMTRASDPRSRVSGNAQARFCRRGGRGDFSPLAIYPRSYGTPREARQSLARYVRFYNHERPHQALAYRTPAEVYAGTRSTAMAGHDLTKGEELRLYDLPPCRCLDKGDHYTARWRLAWTIRKMDSSPFRTDRW